MKKLIISAPVFIVCFMAVYLIASYFPGAQIKLSAPPEVYFIRNFVKLWPLKSAVSGAVSFVVSGIVCSKMKLKRSR